MRVVIDTNVLISSFLVKNSIPSQVIFKILSEHVILTSLPLMKEIREKLPSKKFDKYVDLPTRFALILSLEKRAKLVEVIHKVNVCRDLNDNMYLELALSGKADCIITGDKDLLALNPFENIPIITPKNFLEIS